MKADKKILAIAIKHFDSIKKRGDLKSRCNDSEDFIDALKPEEYNTYPDKEKFFWACICNNADRVLNNCVVYER